MLAQVLAVIKDDYLDKEDWHKSFFNEEDELLKDELIEVITKSILQSSEFYIESIISGEYVKDAGFEESLESYEKALNDLYDSISTVEDSDFHDIIFSKFIPGLKLFLDYYKNFVKIVNIHNINPAIDLIFSWSGLSNHDILGFDERLVAEFNNFRLTLNLNRLDHFFDEDIDYFINLVELENAIIENKNPFKYNSAVILKITFLKYKWSVRQITTSKVIGKSGTVKSYLINNKLFSILDTSPLSGNNVKINEWREYLENHYDLTNTNSYWTKTFDAIKLLDKSSLNYLQLHFLIKFYKDYKPNLENLSKVVTELESRESRFEGNKQDYYKNVLYALNNQFSLLVDQDQPNSQEVENLHGKIIAIQLQSNNDNFFVHIKYLQYKIKTLGQLLKSRQALDKSDSIAVNLRTVRDLLITCESKIVWSKNHHNLLFQLPYDESLIPYNSENISQIYFASSFLLPLSAEQTDYDFSKLKIEFNNKFNHLEALESLHKEFEVIKALKENVETTDKKSIETITIFTAVIAFIVGTISGYSFIDTFFKAIIFLLIFSTSLFTFVSLIFLSTRGLELLKKNKKAFVTIYSILFTFVIVFSILESRNSEFKIESFKKEMHQKIDSLHNSHKRQIDNLKSQQNPIFIQNSIPTKRFDIKSSNRRLEK